MTDTLTTAIVDALSELRLTERSAGHVRADYAVYYLADARAPRWPRYVGCTREPAQRLRCHRSPLHNISCTGIDEWKRSITSAGSEIIMVILSTHVTREEARGVEWRTIWRWQRRGLCDFNAENGRSERWAAFCAGRRTA